MPQEIWYCWIWDGSELKPGGLKSEESDHRGSHSQGILVLLDLDTQQDLKPHEICFRKLPELRNPIPWDLILRRMRSHGAWYPLQWDPTGLKYLRILNRVKSSGGESKASWQIKKTRGTKSRATVYNQNFALAVISDPCHMMLVLCFWTIGGWIQI